MVTDPLIYEHLIEVVDVLRAETPGNMPADVRARRLELLGVLEQYAEAGQFPAHHGDAPAGTRKVLPPRRFEGGRPERPRFVDDGGVHCAVGYLIAVDDPALSLAIDEADPFGWVLEMDLPQLPVWAAEHGFTLDELAWIQPNYEVPAGACEDLTDTPPVPLPATPCEGVHLDVVRDLWSNVCMLGCFDYELVLWVSNTGTEPSPPATLRSLDHDTTLDLPALQSGASVRVSAPPSEIGGEVVVEVAGDCAPARRVVMDGPGGFPMLDRDGDGAGSVFCGGWDCDDRVAGAAPPRCISESGVDPSTCEAPCSVYRCMENLHITESMGAPALSTLGRCLAGPPPTGLPEPGAGCGCDQRGSRGALAAVWLVALLMSRRRDIGSVRR